jgi:hypothetical protein
MKPALTYSAAAFIVPSPSVREVKKWRIDLGLGGSSKGFPSGKKLSRQN